MIEYLYEGVINFLTKLVKSCRDNKEVKAKYTIISEKYYTSYMRSTFVIKFLIYCQMLHV